MTSDAPSRRAILLALGRQRFSFLESRGARLETDDERYRSVLVYSLPDATFEVEYDWREQAVFVLACRSEGGRRPGGYYMDEGQRVRVQLLEALDNAGLADTALREATRASGPDAMATQLTTYSSVLAGRLDDLIERYDRVFPTRPGTTFM